MYAFAFKSPLEPLSKNTQGKVRAGCGWRAEDALEVFFQSFHSPLPSDIVMSRLNLFSRHFSRLSVNRTVNYFCADFGSRTSDWIEWKGFTFECKGWKVFNTIRTECAFHEKRFLQLCDSDITHLLFKLCSSRFRCRSEIVKCKNETFNGSS